MKKYLLFILILSSCYSEQKAKQQFSRASIAYPEILANACADKFPVKDSLIKGDSIITFDTLYVDGEMKTDTLITKDTVRITTIKTLPQKIITNTIHLTDTIYKENTAQLKSSQIDNSKLTELLVKQTAETDKAKHGRNIWRLIAICCMVIIGVGTYFKIAKIGLPKIKI